LGKVNPGAGNGRARHAAVIGAAIEVQRLLGPGLLEGAIEAVLPVHRARLLSYLRISRKQLGLPINFHQWPLTRGIHRIADRTQHQ
jgi:hypothetical protein